MRRKKNRQEGMITVEGVLSLVPFIIVILGIISFINIFAVHNKIQYAIYQMGSELSCYTYFYQALGVRSGDLELKEYNDANTEKLDSAIDDVESFLEQISSLDTSVKQVKNSSLLNAGTNIENLLAEGEKTYDQGKKLAGTARELLSDPKALLRGFISLGLEKAEAAAKNFLLEVIASGLSSVYLDESFQSYQPRTADQYLKYYGVKDGLKGLDFGQSELFNDDKYKMIDIVVEYDIEVYLFKLFFKDPTIHVVQRCSIPAWLDGDGGTYK